jgi:hypothetical protein
MNRWETIVQRLELNNRVMGLVEDVTDHNVTVLVVDPRFRVRGIISETRPVNFNVTPPREVFPGDILPDLRVMYVDDQEQCVWLAMEADYERKCEKVNWNRVQKATLRHRQKLEDEQIGWLDDFNARQELGESFRTYRLPGADGELDMDNPAEMIYEQIDELADSVDIEKD